MARIEISTFVCRYRQLVQDIESITKRLVELVKTSVENEWLSTVPGLCDTTIVDLLAEIGSFSHYDDPRLGNKLWAIVCSNHRFFQLIKLLPFNIHISKFSIFIFTSPSANHICIQIISKGLILHYCLFLVLL
jgi:hypothetical protein